jgi:hypothetical protein
LLAEVPQAWVAAIDAEASCVMAMLAVETSA